MQLLKHNTFSYLKLFVFWILLFDFQRLLFSIHNWDKFSDVSWGEWFLTFLYSLRLDISTAAYLSALPIVVLTAYLIHPKKWIQRLFYLVVMMEALMCAMVHAGEINAYPEWNHKLTSRVFTHLSNPDEVFRTADYGMTVWFVIYTIFEVVFAWRIYKWLFKENEFSNLWKVWVRIPAAILFMGVFMSLSVIISRGGLQPIPLNIDSAYFTNNHVANDLAVNSLYFFGNSYLLYNRSEIDDLLPKMDPKRAEELVAQMYTYERQHDVRVLDNERPNVVFIIMESWAAEGIGCLSETKGATPNFDALAEEGLLFTNIYSTGHTSEIGNSSIFSGNPAIPEISISLQPEKHRKLRSLNQDFQDWGYSTNYIFSGDLKYGNIGGYFMDHGFQDVSDENDFPQDLPRGKLNFFDEDLYDILIDRINNTKEPFLHCAFTGSTHSPYDHPKKPNQTWEGPEAAFMNSIIYADDCLDDFIAKCKKQLWYENTLFVFVADHGHATPRVVFPHENEFYRIPLLFWGEPLKKEYRGKRIDKLGSQTDIAATLMYQMNGNVDNYHWSKDLLNPNVPEFALHTVIGGYGWVTPKGKISYHIFQKRMFINTFPKEVEKEEIEKGHALLLRIYDEYKNL